MKPIKSFKFIVFLVMVALLALSLSASMVMAQGGEKGNGGGNGGGKGGGNGGGGGHTETQGNNLSFPAFLADGYTVTYVAEDTFEVVYTGNYPGLTTEQIVYLDEYGPFWYPQKTEGNVWQADYESVNGGNINVDWIDWGDAIEAVNPKMGRPYRLELVLYIDQLPGGTMQAFTMAELEYPSSQNELQGTNMLTYDSSVASVASPNGRIVVQRIEGVNPEDMTWNGSQWTGAGVLYPEPISFGVENNVGGKLIFGASNKGWKPNDLGAYRITFYLESSQVNLHAPPAPPARIGNYNGDGSTFTEVTEGETNTPVVDAERNLTYVDVTVTNGGGGGGKGGGKP